MAKVFRAGDDTGQTNKMLLTLMFMSSAPLALSDFDVISFDGTTFNKLSTVIKNQRDARNSVFVFKENNWLHSNIESRLVNLHAEYFL